MYVETLSGTVAGFPRNSGIIRIVYDIPSGIQGPEHPFPGQPFSGTIREAFLPNTDEGKKCLRLLRRAFDQRLTFQVGTSLTTGRHNTITWTSIHHKTSLHGGPFGFPDDTYFLRVYDELEQKAIRE